ncbi:MAG: hypothetical protein ACI9PU_002484, partial [Ascidiaceihabitans sp.]
QSRHSTPTLNAAVRPVIADFRRNREIRRSVNSQFADEADLRCDCSHDRFLL